jgi:hypothetical protein
MVMQLKVEGAAAKIDAVMKFDKAAWRGVQKGVKEATAQVTAEAQRLVPPMGIVGLRRGAGWGQWTYSRDGRDLSYRRGDFKFKTRFRSRNIQGFREVQGRAQLDTSSPAAAIFLLAGSQNASGHPFNANINKHTGTRQGARDVGMWPRLLTPAYYAKGPVASKTIGKLIEDAVNNVNRA